MQSHIQCTLIIAAPNSPPSLVASATVWKLNHAFPCFLWALLVRYQPRLTHSPHPYTLINHNSASSKIRHIYSKLPMSLQDFFHDFLKKSRIQLSSIVFLGHFFKSSKSRLVLMFDSVLWQWPFEVFYSVVLLNAHHYGFSWSFFILIWFLLNFPLWKQLRKWHSVFLAWLYSKRLLLGLLHGGSSWQTSVMEHSVFLVI